MNILVLQPHKADGSSWYRVEQFAKKAGVLKLAAVEFLNFGMSEELMARQVDAADIFFIRPSEASITSLRQISQLKIKKPVVADIDDGFDNINPYSNSYRSLGTQNVQLEDGKFLWEDGESGFRIVANMNRIDACKTSMEEVDAVMTTTFELKEYAEKFNKNVVVIPNAIDEALFPQIKLQRDKNIRILWSGGSSHYEDLVEIKPSIKKLMERYPNLEFHMAGQVFNGIFKDLPENRCKGYPWVSADGQGFRMATIGADIGICPITDNTFNRLKSSVKYYEYSTLGLPTVAKGIPPYSDDISDGVNGLLYNTPEEFEKKLEELINDPIKRITLADNARRYVLENRNLEEIVKDWVSFLEGCVNAFKQK